MPKTKKTRARKTRRSSKPKVDAYTKVTQAMIETLESGDVGRWSRPWQVTGQHKSAVSGKAYRGVNQWITFMTAWARGYTSNLWLTFKQAKALVPEGERILREREDGEKQPGTQIVFWKFGDKTDPETGEVVVDSNGQPIRVLKYATTYTVFNLDQTNVPAEKVAKHLPVERDNASMADVEQFVADTGATIVGSTDSAYYSPSMDVIGMPRIQHFDDSASYYATLTHELTHWTGHKDRCDRDFSGRFGDNAYAAEELVAEMGSAFLCAKFGIEGKLQHPEYIKHWLGVMKADTKAVFTAASQAQKAVDYLESCQAEREALEAEDGAQEGVEAQTAA